MPRVTIVPADSLVIVDGRGLHVDCSSLAPDIHAIQWDGLTGWVEHNDGTPNTQVSQAEYDALIALALAAWESARAAADAPPEPTPEEILASRLAAIEAKYEAVLGRLRAAMAVAMLADGPGMDAKVAALRAEWSSASSAQSAEIAALIGG